MAELFSDPADNCVPRPGQPLRKYPNDAARRCLAHAGAAVVVGAGVVVGPSISGGSTSPMGAVVVGAAVVVAT